MLDIWRGALATRLSQVLALSDVPADVGQSFTEVWRLAMTQAGSLAQAALAHEQNALLATQSSLTQERKLWDIAIAEAQAQAQSVDQIREVAETRLADIQRLVEPTISSNPGEGVAQNKLPHHCNAISRQKVTRLSRSIKSRE